MPKIVYEKFQKFSRDLHQRYRVLLKTYEEFNKIHGNPYRDYSLDAVKVRFQHGQFRIDLQLIGEWSSTPFDQYMADIYTLLCRMKSVDWDLAAADTNLKRLQEQAKNA